MQQFNSLARDLKLADHRAAPLVPYVSGAVAGAAATFVSYPFDLLRTTLAAQGEPKVLIHLPVNSALICLTLEQLIHHPFPPLITDILTVWHGVADTRVGQGF